jgi:hypothetical protein
MIIKEIKIIEITKTCEAFPSQWSFKTEDKRNGYIRYRFGKLNIYLSDPDTSERNARNNRPILEAYFGDDPNAGELSDDQMLHALYLLNFKMSLK